MEDKPKDILVSRRYGRYYTYIEPLTKDPIIRGYFTLVSSMLLVAFFILFALSPTFSTIVGLFRKIDDQKKILNTLDQKINSLVLAQENYSKIENDLPILETALPKRPLPQDALNVVLNSASGSGVVITSFQIGNVYLLGTNPKSELKKKTRSAPKSVKKDIFEGVPTVGFNVGVRGTKEQISQFIEKVQNHKRILLISNFSISKGNLAKEDMLNLTASIVGNAFYLPDSVK